MFSLLDMSNCARHSIFGTEMHDGDFNMAEESAVKQRVKET